MNYKLIIALLITANSYGQQPAEFKAYTTKIPGSEVSFTMVPIPAGSFTMGSAATEAGRASDEGPQKTIELSAFWMGEKGRLQKFRFLRV